MTFNRANSRPLLITFCGLPGSGKTTVAKQLTKTTGAIRLNTDELWRRLKGCNAAAEYGTVPITKEQLQEYWPMFQKPEKAELALFDRCVIHT